MSRLTPLRSREVFHKLHRLSFVGPIPGGRHARMVHPQTGQIIPVPIHKGKDIGVGLIWEIIKEVGITREEWLEL